MIGPELGTMEANIFKFPELIFNDDSKLYLDYQSVHLKVNDIGDNVFHQGFDTLCWEKTTVVRGTTHAGEPPLRCFWAGCPFCESQTVGTQRAPSTGRP